MIAGSIGVTCHIVNIMIIGIAKYTAYYTADTYIILRRVVL